MVARFAPYTSKDADIFLKEALFVLGLGNALGDLVDPTRDDVGLQSDQARLPKRVRVKKTPTSL